MLPDALWKSDNTAEKYFWKHSRAASMQHIYHNILRAAWSFLAVSSFRDHSLGLNNSTWSCFRQHLVGKRHSGCKTNDIKRRNVVCSKPITPQHIEKKMTLTPSLKPRPWYWRIHITKLFEVKPKRPFTRMVTEGDACSRRQSCLQYKLAVVVRATAS